MTAASGTNTQTMNTPAAEFQLTLWVAGEETNSRTAKANLASLCEAELNGRFVVEIKDVLEDFTLAAERGIMVTPTLLIRGPGPEKRVIGNLSDSSRLRQAFGLESTRVHAG